MTKRLNHYLLSVLHSCTTIPICGVGFLVSLGLAPIHQTGPAIAFVEKMLGFIGGHFFMDLFGF